jgi:hypothetical protein
LFFGLSTALLFAIMSHLIANRLRAEIGYRKEAALNEDPFAAAVNLSSSDRLSATENKT